jgi:hypothetical protein
MRIDTSYVIHAFKAGEVMYFADDVPSNAEDTDVTGPHGPTRPTDRLSTSVTIHGTGSHYVFMIVRPSSFVQVYLSPSTVHPN